MADAAKKAEEKPAEAPKQADASLEDLLEDDEFEEFESEGDFGELFPRNLPVQPPPTFYLWRRFAREAHDACWIVDFRKTNASAY